LVGSSSSSTECPAPSRQASRTRWRCPTGEGAERASAVVDGVQRGQRDLDPPVGVPRVERLGLRERGGVGVARARTAVGERVGGALQADQSAAHGGQFEVDQGADGVGGAERDLLVGDADRARTVHFAAVDGQVAGEHPEQGGLAATVLATATRSPAAATGSTPASTGRPPKERWTPEMRTCAARTKPSQNIRSCHRQRVPPTLDGQ
jgi:hypothetical protein